MSSIVPTVQTFTAIGFKRDSVQSYGGHSYDQFRSECTVVVADNEATFIDNVVPLLTRKLEDQEEAYEVIVLLDGRFYGWEDFYATMTDTIPYVDEDHPDYERREALRDLTKNLMDRFKHAAANAAGIREETERKERIERERLEATQAAARMRESEIAQLRALRIKHPDI